MSTVYYPADLYDTTWHDGSPVSAADFVMSFILTFDIGKEDSPVYDPVEAGSVESFLEGFKGARFVSTDPLVIEWYSDLYTLDAENNVTTLYPNYGYGPGAWHNLALGLLADERKEASFGDLKSEELEVEWLSYISGPALDVLNNQMVGTEDYEGAAATGYVPYAATLADFVTDDEVATRWTNLQEWFRRRGHFHIGTGPLYLERAFPVEATVILQRYQAYPDLASKWAAFGAGAPVPEVVLDGPGTVTIGDEATYDVFIDFMGEPYALDDLDNVAWLLFDATGAVAATGAADADSDGLYTITLGSDITGALEAGSNQLKVVVVSKLVALPAADIIQFVTSD